MINVDEFGSHYGLPPPSVAVGHRSPRSLTLTSLVSLHLDWGPLA
jgi:hypothetical protein